MAKILVIEDDVLVQRTIERILKKADHDVQLAANGLEGLRAFRTLYPDIVVTDIVMPVKEGLDTIQILRDWSPEARIVAISGGGRLANKDYLAKAAELGANAVLAKPFDPEELLAAITQCLVQGEELDSSANGETVG